MANGALAGRSIFIVEDEPLLALEVHAAFDATDASIVSAANAKQALRTIDELDLSAAVVDINLGSENCSAVCKRLADRGIPFIFYTGEARADILLKWPEAPVLTKLADTQRIVGVVASVLR